MKKGKLYLICLLCILTNNLYAQSIVADFSSDKQKGCNPVVVIFQNTSTPVSGSTYHWDFGDGQSSDALNPVIEFNQPGVYDVTLIVSNAGETDTIIKPAYITVFKNPEPAFHSNETVGCSPFQVQFINETIVGDTSIYIWHWDFGNGHVSSQQNPQQIFDYQDNYSISLYVRDYNNCSNVLVLDNYISAYKPNTDFSVDNSVSCTGSLEATFTNLSTGEGDLSYAWTFGDGNSSTNKDPVHLYDNQGTYNVQLITTDILSCKDTLIKYGKIQILDLYAEFTVNKDTLCKNENLSFTNTSQAADSYLWYFGDGSTSSLENPVHKYLQAGDYNVMLIASNSQACSDTFVYKINIEEIIAAYSSSTDFGCSTPLTVNYTNNSINAVQWKWLFGNGLISFAQNPENIYSKEGVYNDTLIVTSKHGCKSTIIKNESLTIVKPRAAFTPNDWVETNDIKGCTPLIVNFKDKSSYNTDKDAINSWRWEFGDGNYSTIKNPLHLFGNVGIFPIELTITTNLGCTSVYSATVKTGTKQNADFEIDQENTICASTPVQFTDKSENKSLVNEWYWIFGDGETSQKQNPLHTFVDTGYMDVKLLVYHNGCPDFELKEKLIYIKGPYIKPSYSTICSNPLNAILKSNSIDGEKIFWDFGDGSPVESGNFNPQHMYPSRGDYVLTLTAENNTNGCSFTTNKDINIREVQASFEASELTVCAGTTIDFDSENSLDEYFFKINGVNGKYYWNFGDGTKEILSSPLVSHKFTTKGTYDVKLTVKDFRGCSDSIIQRIKVFKPQPDFIAKDFTGCLPMSVNFENTTTPDTTIVQWVWNFGDNTSSQEETPVHLYTAHGLYTISLIATDTLGCIGSLTKNSYIEVLKPIPEFIVNNQSLCFGDTVKFSSLPTYPVSSYLWDFGDGTTSNLADPYYIYPDSGHFDISLKLVDEQGCDSTLLLTNYIHVQKANLSDFSVDTTFTNCYPLISHFTDLTQGPYTSQWLWSFDENQSSSHLQNPTHTYTKPGIYDVSLTAITSYGCKNTITKKNLIEIGGPFAEINAPDIICKNTDVTLIANNKINVYDLQWFLNDGTVENSDTVVHSYNRIGDIYPVLLIMSDNKHTCDKYIIDTIHINNLTATISGQNEDFKGCVPFHSNFINNSIGGDSYVWTFGDGSSSTDINPYHIYNNPGKFNVNLFAFDSFGCRDTFSIDLTVFPLPKLKITTDTLICKGESTLIKASGAKDYYWYPSSFLDNNNIESPTASPEYNIKYNLAAIDSNKCINYASTIIKVQQEPSININDTSIIIGETLAWDIYANDISSYLWNSYAGYEISDSSYIELKPLESTSYSVTVKDINGCFEVTKDIAVDIIKKYTVDVPTAFTPNGDGINDFVFVKGWGVKDLISFRIFNRYGTTVFESQDKETGWDGTYKGNPQNIETYTYIVKVRTYDDEILTKSGTIKLLR